MTNKYIDDKNKFEIASYNGTCFISNHYWSSAHVNSKLHFILSFNSLSPKCSLSFTEIADRLCCPFEKVYYIYAISCYNSWFIIHGLPFMVYHSWIIIHGLSFMVYPSWFIIHGLSFMVYHSFDRISSIITCFFMLGAKSEWCRREEVMRTVATHSSYRCILIPCSECCYF